MDVMTSWGRQLAVGAEELATHLASRTTPADADLWLDGLEERVATIRAGLAGLGRCMEHGGYDGIVADAPRLTASLSRLCGERSRLLGLVDDLSEACEHARSSAEPDLDHLERTARVLLLRTRMANHRAMAVARDAYDVDLGGPTG